MFEDYLALGWRLLPMRPRGKEPLTAHGVKDATTDPAIIKEWLKRWPSMNIGIATGPESGLVVIDIDGGKNGKESWEHLRAGRSAPHTNEVLTGSGRHLYFKHPGGSVKNAVNLAGLPGLDVRSEGGYVVAPPSVHPNGKQYQWQPSRNPQDVAAADLPEWLLTLLRNGAAPKEPSRSGAPIGEGERNTHLTAVAGRLRHIGMEYESIRAGLLVENAKCKPPLPESEIDTIARSVSRYDVTNALLTLRQTDSGNADRFIYLFGDLLRYCADYRQWFIWEKNRWRRDDQRIVLSLGHAMLMQLYNIGQSIDNDKERSAFMTYVASIDRLGKIQNAIEWASSIRKVAVRPENLDRDGWLLNLQNGTYNLKDGSFREHRPEDLITKLAGTYYDPQAKCPRWMKFLEEVFPQDPYLRVFIQQAVGYSLTGDTREQCLFILHGTGSNGKSTFLETVANMLADYAVRTPVDSLMIRRGESIPNDLARLKGARLVHAAETESGKRLAESLIKSLTGGDSIVARYLHAEFFEYKPTFKIFLATNHRPVIHGQDLAIWRRVRLVPFVACFPPEVQDKRLSDTLMQELPGILNLALEGCEDWKRNGLSLPAAVNETTENYRTEMDTLAEFLDECTISDKTGEVSAQVLYEEYRRYCERAGDRIASKRMLGMQLEERGYRSVKRTGGQRAWKFISLKSPVESVTACDPPRQMN